MSMLNNFVNRYNIVKQIPIFANLTWFDLQRIARKTVIDEYDKGEVIRSEGDPPDFFYCLISGRVRTYTVNESGLKENVEFIHRGVHFGIVSLLTGKNHALNYEAVNDSIILKIDKDDFHQILKSIPSLSIEFNQSLSQRVRSATKGVKTIFESTIISVYSPQKGTGSSAYSMNLALNLQRETKKRVVYVNIESQIEDIAKIPKNEVTPRWKKEPVKLDDIITDHDQIVDAIQMDSTNIDLLNVIFDPKGVAFREEVSHFLSALVGDYHYVVVDLPTQMDQAVLETLTQSDLVHLITSDRKQDLTLAKSVIDKLELSLKENFKEERIKVIIRAFHPKIYLSFEQINKYIDFSVYTSLPLIMRDELTVAIDTNNFSFLVCDKQSQYAKTVRRIAREIGGVLVGLVLGGGAALGVAHVGVLRVLEEEGIQVDMIVGSSMGALVGSFWASGMTIDELEGAAREFEKKLFMAKLFDPVIPIKGLVGGRLIKRWLKKYLGNKTFYNVRVPFKVVAYDLRRREEIVIDGGHLVEGVRRSIAIPGVIEPICRDQKEIIDGGVLNPLPTNVLASRGIKKIIAVNVLQSPEDVSVGIDILQDELDKKKAKSFFKNPFHYVNHRIGRSLSKALSPNISDIIVRTLQACEYVIAEQSAQQADVVIHPDLVGINWYELYRVDELIKAGEDATREQMPHIKKLVEEK